MDKEKLKIFAFGAMTIALIWLGFGVRGKTDYLNQALMQIDSARQLIKLAHLNIDSAQHNIDSARTQLNGLRQEAGKALVALDNLREERQRIIKEFNTVLIRSQQNLVSYRNSMDDILAKQKRMLDTIEQMRIDDIIIEPSKIIANGNQ